MVTAWLPKIFYIVFSNLVVFRWKKWRNIMFWYDHLFCFLKHSNVCILNKFYFSSSPIYYKSLRKSSRSNSIFYMIWRNQSDGNFWSRMPELASKRSASQKQNDRQSFLTDLYPKNFFDKRLPKICLQLLNLLTLHKLLPPFNLL